MISTSEGQTFAFAKARSTAVRIIRLSAFSQVLSPKVVSGFKKSNSSARGPSPSILPPTAAQAWMLGQLSSRMVLRLSRFAMRFPSYPNK